jgi:3-deoxy-D-manno-oct-2-ulosonic acid (Kdo) hydroxylase
MPRIEVADYRFPGGWMGGTDVEWRARTYCAHLETGGILFFPGVPFHLPEPHRQSLLAKRQSGLRFHKNISYRPLGDELRGFASDQAGDEDELKAIMRAYSASVTGFVRDFLRPYDGQFTLDYASYRPVEEAGRDLSLHKRNDLLHVDAFPSRPTAGGRILRVFTNINPSRSRSWLTSEGFGRLAERYARAAGLDRIARHCASLPYAVWSRLGALSRRLAGGKGSRRTGYDRFMLHFHDWLKENEQFQRACIKDAHEFPPGSTWLVYTDYVPHAVLAGQFALEQTFIISLGAMVVPEQAPIRVLERLSGRRLAA